MAKIWAGRSDAVLSAAADSFNSSIGFDSRMYRQDILGSVAHAEMLARCGIISEQDAGCICKGLKDILADIESGKLVIDAESEDIHSFVEQTLTERIGEAGKRLHTARSRNDQVALDLRMFLLSESDMIKEKLKELITVLTDKAEEYKDTVMPGYTHLQRAQPVSFGHWLMAYTMMFLRDCDRLCDWRKRTNVSPIGSCAFAGTTYNTDRKWEAERLGFEAVSLNSVDGVSDRDFCIEFCSVLSLIMAHISRLSEEIILWTSWEFKFVKLDDAFTTGSSIMPQKKNSDMAELSRGKTGRVYGDLMTLLTMIKGLPLAYNKDMQEDKEAVFDALDTVKSVLNVFVPMLSTMTANEENMYNAARKGFINATDLADYLTKKGMPFRTAYKTVGALVTSCEEKGIGLDQLSLEDFKQVSPLIEDDVYSEISLEACVARRNSFGGTSRESVEAQIVAVRELLNK